MRRAQRDFEIIRVAFIQLCFRSVRIWTKTRQRLLKMPWREQVTFYLIVTLFNSLLYIKKIIKIGTILETLFVEWRNITPHLTLMFAALMIL